MKITSWEADKEAVATDIEVLFVSPEYRPNLSNMIRTAEFYGLTKVYVYDENGLLSPPSSKITRADMDHMGRVWTAGASDFIEIITIKDLYPFLEKYEGRKIATVLDPTATVLGKFRFEQKDLLIMGSEKEGLSHSIISLCDNRITIPAKGSTDCLNVSTSFGIFLHKFINDIHS